MPFVIQAKDTCNNKRSSGGDLFTVSPIFAQCCATSSTETNMLLTVVLVQCSAVLLYMSVTAGVRMHKPVKHVNDVASSVRTSH